MANTITLDGINFTEDCLEIQDISDITIQLDETSSIVDKSIASDFTFIGDAYDYIINKFFGDSEEGCDAIIDVVININCCVGTELLYNLTYESVLNCPSSCEVKTVLTRVSTDNEGFNYLQRTRVADNDMFNNVTTPHLEYCSGNLGGFLAALYVFLSGILFSLNLIILVVNLFIPGGNNDIPLFDSETLDGIIGCDKQAPGFVVPEMLSFHAAGAGLTFQSTTIFDLPNYDKTTVIAMAYKDGENKCPNEELFIENRPNRNVIQFMEQLSPLYAAKTRIRNGVLIFENEEWFEQNLYNLGSVDDMYFKDDEGLCYSYDLDEQYAAYGRFAYAYDANDQMGNRVAPKYNDIIEWNPNGLNSRKGEYSNIALDFSTLYFLGVELVASNSPFAGLIGHALITNGQASQYKIYQWDGANVCKSRCVLPTFPYGNASYNFPYTFLENQGDPSNLQPSLYDQFHKFKTPLERPCPLKVDDFTFVAPDFCSMVADLEVYGTDVYISCEYGKITPSSISINLDEQSFTWSECKIVPE